MLIHPGPEFSVSDVHDGWMEGLSENGCEARSLNLQDRLFFYSNAGRLVGDEFQPFFNSDDAVRHAAHGISARCFEWWPDIVLIVSGFFVPVDLIDVIRSRGIKVAYLFTESPYEDDRQVMRAAHCDLAILNDPTNIDRFRQVTKTTYLPHAYRPHIHKPGPVVDNLRCDVGFVGTGYPSRVSFMEAVDWTGLDVALAGNWQGLTEESPLRKFVAHDLDACMDNADTVKLYNSAQSSLNLYRREAERPELEAGWSMGPREVELAAAGCFYLTQERGENREVLPMVPTFDGPDDFGEKVRWWLDHDTERESVAGAARAAIADRSFAANAAQMLRLLTD